jgi:putative transposase
MKSTITVFSCHYGEFPGISKIGSSDGTLPALGFNEGGITMKYNPELHHRRSIRLRDFYYGSPRAYFITICTWKRECTLGEVMDGKVILSLAGKIAYETWFELPKRFPTVCLDSFEIMPNHLHGVLELLNTKQNRRTANQGAINRAPTESRKHVGAQFTAPKLGEIIRTFKALVTQRARAAGIDVFAWQRNYYEHIIRNDEELSRIRQYIEENPLRWEEDENHPDRILDQKTRAR